MSQKGLEKAEKYVGEHTSGEELELYKRSKEMLLPRDEYKEGKLKLDFVHTFQNGDIFKATEDNEGFAKIIVERQGEKVLDFDELLTEGYRFATPSYLKTHESDKAATELAGRYFVHRDKQLVFVGNIRTPDDIFAVLHEAGHTHQKRQELKNGRPRESVDDRTKRLKDEIAEFSRRERDAWKVALKTARAIKRERHIDLFESYKNFGAIKRVIYVALLSHRLAKEYFKVEASEFSEEDMKIFKDLFDKGKFGKSGSKNPESNGEKKN